MPIYRHSAGDRTPYVYLLGWTYLPKPLAYVGVRYGINCHPDDLMKTYFTSSKIAKRLINNGYKPDLISIIPCKSVVAAQCLETRLQQHFEVLGANKDRWLNNSVNGKLYTDNTGKLKGRPKSDETKKRMSASAKRRGPRYDLMGDNNWSRRNINKMRKMARLRVEKSPDYLFVNFNGDRFVGKAHFFTESCGLDRSSVTRIIKNPFSFESGWVCIGKVDDMILSDEEISMRLIEIKTRYERRICKKEKFLFQNNDQVIELTRKEFRELTGCSTGRTARLITGRKPFYKGWVCLGPADINNENTTPKEKVTNGN